jgi:hypothetical protein
VLPLPGHTSAGPGIGRSRLGRAQGGIPKARAHLPARLTPEPGGLTVVRPMTDHQRQCHLDYTEAFGRPEEWLSQDGLRRVARHARLSADDARAWSADPSGFFHARDNDEEPVERWERDPLFAQAVDMEWTARVQMPLAAPRRTGAGHDVEIGGQFSGG